MPEDQIHELVTESLAAVGLKVLIELLNISSQDKVITVFELTYIWFDLMGFGLRPLFSMPQLICKLTALHGHFVLGKVPVSNMTWL